MIPLKLHIKNFISYGSPAQIIDFEPHHLICLVGKNGHGKSALLDAITWAVWGQARKTTGSSKADEGLIRLGQTHMYVFFDFMHNDNRYRVRREYEIERSKGTARLDFGIIDVQTGQFKSLSEKTIRDTQEKIELVLGLNFDSFVNSVFLRQGGSNEFSKKSPRERKEILAHMIGAATYEICRKRATEKIRSFSQTKLFYEKQKESLQDEQNKSNTPYDNLTGIKTQYAHILEQENEYQTKKKLIEQEIATITATVHRLEQTKRMHAELQCSYNHLLEKIRTTLKEWRSIHKKNLQRKIYKNIAQEKQNIELQLNHMQFFLQKRMALSDELLYLKNQCTFVIKKIQKQYQQREEQQSYVYQQYEQICTVNQQQINYYTTAIEEKKAAEIMYHTTENDLQKKLKEIERRCAVFYTTEIKFERIKKAYHQYIAKKEFSLIELKNQNNYQNTINTAGSCPLCKQTVDDTYQMKNGIEKKIKFIERRYKRLEQIILNLKNLLISYNNELISARELHTERSVIKTNIQHTQNAQQDLIQTMQKLEKTRSNHIAQQSMLKKKLNDAWEYKQSIIAQLPRVIKTDKAYYFLQERIIGKESELITYDFNQEHYHMLTQQLHEISEIEITQKKYSSDTALLQQQKKGMIHELCKRAKEIHSSMDTLALTIIDEKIINNEFNNAHLKKQQIDLHITNIQTLKEQLTHQRGALEQSCIHFEQRKKKIEQIITELGTIDEEISDYLLIAHAFGKDGIQGLLIENIIPEIEDEANHILAQLTNNSTHLMIESTKDLKNGNSKETLDIKISDSIGIRPYELFSGGEAFRIDFSLRIAISKLLSRRKGAALQTLIIDEGFGSQDEDGLHQITEALHAIKNDFEKIIIVSHLPTMKEQFPTQFYITKSSRGSIVTVIEQG